MQNIQVFFTNQCYLFERFSDFLVCRIIIAYIFRSRNGITGVVDISSSHHRVYVFLSAQNSLVNKSLPDE